MMAQHDSNENYSGAADSTSQHGAHARTTARARVLQKTLNPLQVGIREFVTRHLPSSALTSYGLSPERLVGDLPRRYTIYSPLLLLPANAFRSPAPWCSLYHSLTDHQQQDLYASIADAFRSMGVSHIAVNAPIVPRDVSGNENRIRSPTGLICLYGNFGLALNPRGAYLEDIERPSESNFESAFWVRTVQNGGIVQTWAPLYTMFSRGNITEKARILGQGGMFDGLDDSSLEVERIQDVSVVDLYAGIGYFIFSYVKRGVKRVWGWEINGWSVEGLRRGCAENGWGCKVVSVTEEGEPTEGFQALVNGIKDTDRVIVFHGDNKFAAQVTSTIKSLLENQDAWNRIRHVNLGLLPTSQSAWETAYKLLDPRYGGWIHVHENVDIQQISERREVILNAFRRLSSLANKNPGCTIAATVECRHVERVKTYAPGIIHCVFDIRLSF